VRATGGKLDWRPRYFVVVPRKLGANRCGVGTARNAQGQAGFCLCPPKAEAKAAADVARPGYETKKAVYDAKKSRRGRAPKPPDEDPPADRQTNLTDPDSALVRRSDAHEYRQAYNAQAVVYADERQLVLATALVATTADAPSFAATVLGMQTTIGLPKTVLADTATPAGRP
jgi:hypothetical protein